MWAITYLAQLHPLIGEFFFSLLLLLLYSCILPPSALMRLRKGGTKGLTRDMRRLDEMTKWHIGSS